MADDEEMEFVVEEDEVLETASNKTVKQFVYV